MTLVKHFRNMWLQRTIYNSFGPDTYAIIQFYLRQTDHFATIFQYRYPEFPILTCNDLFAVSAYSFPFYFSVKRTGINHIFTCQQFQRERRQLPFTTTVAYKFSSRTDHFNLRVSFQFCHSMTYECWADPVIRIYRQNVFAMRQ